PRPAHPLVAAYATRLHRLGRTGGATPLDCARPVAYSSDGIARVASGRRPAAENGEERRALLQVRRQRLHRGCPPRRAIPGAPVRRRIDQLVSTAGAALRPPGGR